MELTLMAFLILLYIGHLGKMKAIFLVFLFIDGPTDDDMAVASEKTLAAKSKDSFSGANLFLNQIFLE